MDQLKWLIYLSKQLHLYNKIRAPNKCQNVHQCKQACIKFPTPVYWDKQMFSLHPIKTNAAEETCDDGEQSSHFIVISVFSLCGFIVDGFYRH